jgi:hypothetical protein
VLVLQVERRRFHPGEGMDGGAQIEGLLAAAARIAIREFRSHRVEDHLLPSRVLRGLEFLELLGRIANDLEALRRQPGLDGFIVRRSDDRCMQLADIDMLDDGIDILEGGVQCAGASVP